MKKIIFSFLFATFFIQLQAQPLAIGDKVLGVSGGFGNFEKIVPLSVFSLTSSNLKIRGYGQWNAKYEIMLGKNVSTTIGVNFLNYNAAWTTNSYYGGSSNESTSLTFNSVSAILRLNGYLVNKEKYCLYAGMGCGYRYALTETTTSQSNVVTSRYQHQNNIFPVGFEATVGGKYFLTRDLGAFVEVGLAKSFMQGGIFYRY